MAADTNIPLMTALRRGVLGRCPNCGKGHLLYKYLKVHAACSVCGEELYHQRADDFPAYLVVAITGHIVLPALLWTEVNYAPAYWVQMAIWLPMTLFLALGLLPLVKGFIIALQWHLGMDGFGPAKRLREEIAPQL